MDLSRKGQDALSAGNPTLALSYLTKALIQHPKSPDYYISRSTAFNRLSKHDFALSDAEKALHYAKQRAKRDKMQAAQMRRVISLYQLGRYAEAKAVMAYITPWIDENNKKGKMEVDMWSKKIDKKMAEPESEKGKGKDVDVAATEFPPLQGPTSEKQIVAELQTYLFDDGSFNFDGNTQPKAADNPSSQPTIPPSEPAATSSSKPVASTTPSAPATIRHEFYQSSTAVTLTLYAKGVSKDLAEVDLTSTTLSISFPHPSDSSRTFSFNLDPLYSSIVPEESTYKIMSTKIEFTLKKATAGQKWPALEGDATDNETGKISIASSQVTPAIKEKAPAYPTSSRTGPKDWDAVASAHTRKPKSQVNENSRRANKSTSDSNTTNNSHSTGSALSPEAKNSNDDDGDDDDDDVKIDSDEEGGDEVDGFFKKLYKGSSDDTRRAMMKSFYESNGTALSTNWDEVGKGRVEVVEPKGD